MSSTRKNFPSTSENFSTHVDLASSLVEGTPENSGHFTPTINESIVDEDNTPEEDFRDILDRVINDNQWFGEDYLHSTALTLIENSTDTYVFPQKIHEYFELKEDEPKNLCLVLM